MQKRTYHDIELHIDELASFIFLRNVNNAILDLSLGGLENNKDLFFFCLDLFCKGLVLTVGNGTSVDLEDLTMNDFLNIKTKMICAGIEPILQIFPADIDEDNKVSEEASVKNKLNLDELQNMDDNSPMSDFMFKVCSKTSIFIVQFKLIHNSV
jgi:hypothetical protein